MKKILSSIIAILIATLGIITVSASYSPSNVIGDTNGDGNVTITDATLVQKHIAQLTDIEDNNLAYADVDGNDTISIIDATLIQKKLANIISIFPAETAPTTVPTTVPATSGENILTSQYSPNEMELEMLEIINQHRAEAGVHPLEFGYFYYDCDDKIGLIVFKHLNHNRSIRRCKLQRDRRISVMKLNVMRVNKLLANGIGRAHMDLAL